MRHSIRPRVPIQLLAVVASAGAVLLSGCLGTDVRELSPDESILVALDANARTVRPGQRLKFWVDVRNTTSRRLDLDEIAIELLVSPAGNPAKVALRKTWTYRWTDSLTVAPDRQITLPIVPETRTVLAKTRRTALRSPDQVLTLSEFPLADLSPGPYEIRARVAERFVSQPYPITVRRPDLVGRPTPGRRGNGSVRR